MFSVLLNVNSSICEPNITCLLYGTLNYLLQDMQTIEKIQRRAIKLIPSLKQDSYNERCPDVQPEFTKFIVSPT